MALITLLIKYVHLMIFQKGGGGGYVIVDIVEKPRPVL